MSRLVFSYLGRIDQSEAMTVLGLVGKACSGDLITKSSVLVPASEDIKAAAGSLMALTGVVSGADGHDRFPVVTLISKRHDGLFLSVDIHPRMREPDALPALVAHLVGGILGRLAGRAWGRWDSSWSEQTGHLLDSVGAGRMRFSQFGDEVLRTGLPRLPHTCGMSLSSSVKRSGRGGKVVGVTFSMGPRPTWLGEQAAARHHAPVHASVPLPPLPARTEFMAMLASVLATGRDMESALQAMSDWLSPSPDPADVDMATTARSCISAGDLSPIAPALDIALVASFPDMCSGVSFLAGDGCWPGGEVGQQGCQAWVLRAAALAHDSTLGPTAALRRIRSASESDVASGWVSVSDGEFLRSMVDCLHGAYTDPKGPAEASRPPLTVRENLLLACAMESQDVAGALRMMVPR